MGRHKKYLRKSINFGDETNPARRLVEQWIELRGERQLSALMRKLVVVFLSQREDHKSYHRDLLLHEFRTLGHRVGDISNRRDQIRAELALEGIDADEACLKFVGKSVQ